ncbi:Fe-S oxidoreductase [Clostridium acidisoli DSM 12555]|uniref:Fe-S oxidoreductase n=1 Tax=Clostridium acidisoli DSM 12555 TaxID=1121291 RepID=A0A1W1X6X6_9CLOT|nr:radical SAM protein [Clostridium acidisoli]SMC19564.1 Fe-S oxidoreductase [Clostridium acidisoli DSM 12555]
MRYEGIVYRPPSEANSLIIQVTIGCAHNKCSFCSMYKNKKFRIRSIDEIYEDLEDARKKYKFVERIFLADGDALVLPINNLRKILKKIQTLFPECKRIGTYGTPKDVLRKSTEELIELKNLGIEILYMGLESGSDIILKEINKGVTASRIIEAGQKVKSSGIKLSVTLISGIGGKDKYIEHAKESGKVISSINPDYIGLLTLMVEKNTPIYEEVNSRKFKLLGAEEIMLETKELIKNLSVTNCIFRSNHPSNYVNINGKLPEDKENMIKLIDDIIDSKCGYREEKFRML